MAKAKVYGMAKARKAKGITQQRIADILGTRATTVSAWETGKVEPRTKTVIRLASILGVSIKDLLSEDNAEPKIENALKKARKTKNMTQGQIASKLGIARNTYTLYELGELAVPPERIGEIAALLDISIEDIESVLK